MKTRSLLQFGFYFACAAWFGLAAPRAHAQATPNAPGKMSYQGFLTDDTGVPLGGSAPLNRDIVFRLYTAPTGGTLKWAEQQTVTLDKGFFTVQLGEGSGVGSSPFTNNLASLFTGSDASDRYLEVTVKGSGGGSDLTVTPRVQLLTSPYAFLAQNAVAIVSSAGQPLVTTSGSAVGINLSGVPTATLDVNGVVKATSFTGSGVGLTGIPTASLADSSITSAKIANDAVGSSEIAVGAVGSSEIADQSIQSSDIANGAIGVGELQNNAVNSSKILDNSITTADLVDSIGVWKHETDSGGEIEYYVGSNNGTGVQVGINTTTPSRPLHVVAAKPPSDGRYFCMRLEAGTTGDYWDFALDDDDGESVDDADLDFLYKGTPRGSLDPRGGGFSVPSDRRLKTDIEVLPGKTLSNVMKIPAVRFRMIDQPTASTRQIGVIAQDLQAVFPELVDDHNEMLAVRYERIGVISMAAVQELKTEKDAEIGELKTENESLRQQMSQILERLKALEQKGR